MQVAMLLSTPTVALHQLLSVAMLKSLFPVCSPSCADLSRLAGPKARSHLGAEKSVRLAVSMLLKTLLQVGGT